MTTRTPFFFGFLTAADCTQAGLAWLCRQAIPTGIQKTEQLYAALTSEEAQELYSWTRQLIVALFQLTVWSTIWACCQVKLWIDNTVAECQAPKVSLEEAWAEIDQVTEEVMQQTNITEEQLQSYEVPTVTPIRLEDLPWNTLRSVAAQHQVKGRKKTELLQGLHDLGITHYVG